MSDDSETLGNPLLGLLPDNPFAEHFGHLAPHMIEAATQLLEQGAATPQKALQIVREHGLSGEQAMHLVECFAAFNGE